MAESFRRRIVIARWRDREESAVRASRYSEDKIFADSYVCLPFDTGAIALGVARRARFGRQCRSDRRAARAVRRRLADGTRGGAPQRT